MRGPFSTRPVGEEAVRTTPAKPTTVVTFASQRERMPPFEDPITCDLSEASDQRPPEDHHGHGSET